MLASAEPPSAQQFPLPDPKHASNPLYLTVSEASHVTKRSASRARAGSSCTQSRNGSSKSKGGTLLSFSCLESHAAAAHDVCVRAQGCAAVLTWHLHLCKPHPALARHMAVLLETSRGDLVIDLFTDECPQASTNFLKLCKCVFDLWQSVPFQYFVVHTWNSWCFRPLQLGPTPARSHCRASLRCR